MADTAPAPEPSRARKVVAAIITAGVVLAVWWVIEWRSAPPPLPVP